MKTFLLGLPFLVFFLVACSNGGGGFSVNTPSQDDSNEAQDSDSTVTPSPSLSPSPSVTPNPTPSPTVSPSPSPTPPTTDICESQSSQLSASEKTLIGDVCRLVNIERAKVGLAPLTLETQRTHVAQAHSIDMATRNFFNHTNPDGQDPFARIRAAGISYRAAGENIAMGQTSAQQVMTSWMNSSGHKANILNSNFKRLGVGVYNWRWTQVFTD